MLVLIAVLFAVHVAIATQCCIPDSRLSEPLECDEYCCDILLTKTCCTNPILQVSSNERFDGSCSLWWISEHVWVPIVSGIAFLIVIIAICTCCCCCGCCACCRSSPAPVYIHTGAASPTTAVMMSSTTHQQSTTTNPMHYGYNQ